jgi:catechol 2,3-dioxygenase-like lactoylglutathione lyase family enzyme
MAVAMFLTLRMPPHAYDRLLQSLKFDATPPVGEILHLAAETPDGIEVCEIWQTREAAEGFVRDVLGPRLHEAGAKEPVDYAIFPLHNLYAPDLDTIERIGTVSLPGVSAGTIFP